MTSSPSKSVLVAIPTEGIDGQARLNGIYRYLSEGHYWNITLIRTRADFSESEVKKALARGIDGAILAIPHSPAGNRILSATDLPLVAMTATIQDIFGHRRPRTAFSFVDNEQIGRFAAEYYISRGNFLSYAFVFHERNSRWAQKRLAGFRRALPPDRPLFVHKTTTASPDMADLFKQEPLLEFISSLPRPSAVFTSNDIVGAQVLEACNRLNITVPTQISVLGVDNFILFCEHSKPKLSSIEPDFENSGYRGAQILDRMMSGRVKRNQTILSGISRFVERESTCYLKPSAKLVSDALAIIRSEAFNGITAAEVVRRLKVSRSLAVLRFRELTGDSIGATILRLRLEKVRELLVQTNWSMRRIALEAGFRDVNVCRNRFRIRFGESMTAFRNRNGKPPSRA